jgi:uncharacterized protein (DUF983 family)
MNKSNKNNKVMFVSVGLLCVVVACLLVAAAVSYEQSTFNGITVIAPAEAVTTMLCMIAIDGVLVACAVGLFGVAWSIIKKYRVTR